MTPEHARIADSFARQTFMATLRADLLEVAPGRVRIAAPLLAECAQQHGAGHAGVTFALGDSAAGYAALSVMPEGREVMTVEMKINLLAPATGRRLVATGEVLRSGRRLVVVRASVVAERDGGPVTVAEMLGTMIPVDA
ncbi:PaaI family thioesterase [Rhodobaculum claviforme]|uniref:Medium/long-chain acyl-CoA thioesterase YigI n=1 Tax=Rhodobaculum claviforme TaxID=1549854 RepID=A0A934TMN0_9RHOB|nr:PaaI family thioesterase [Rhodobaculum claviforme]MBK5928344.1 phenylacetic acid degradation protein [Rhodobaculum claviforme]